MLVIEAAGRRLLYTGDFRIHGRKTGVVERLMAHPPERLDALVMEGTTLGRGGEIRSEDDIEVQFTDLFKRTKGRVFVAWAGSQVDRTVTLVRACMRAKRPLVIDIYTADILRRLLRWSPRLPRPGRWPVRTVITSRLANLYRRRGWGQTVDDLARDRLSVRRLRYDPRAVIMVRESLLPDFTRGGLVPTPDDAWSWSQWRGYLQTPKGRTVEDWFAPRGCPHEHLHTSGHARPDDLRAFANAMRPGVLIPVHGEHWDESHAGFPMIKRLGDGQSWSLGSV
jgi:ribonuclease J